MATIFTAIGAGRGNELWVSYGTSTSTFLLKDVRAGGTGSAPLILGYLAVNGVADPSRALFTANDGTNGDELWVTDGTAAGTVLFKDINAGSGGSFASTWVNAGPRSIFTATDGTSGTELWVSTGTAVGTVLLQDLNAGAASSMPVFLGYLQVNGVADATKAMFTLSDGSSGREVWVTDGTPGGTALLKDINPGSGSSDASAWVSVNGHAVFTANDGISGRELWVSDGTGATTSLLLDAAGGLAGSDPEILGYLRINGAPDTTRLLVSLDNITNGRELWVTDGTTAGTMLFKDLEPGSTGSGPGPWTFVSGRGVFVATTSFGTELWRSDGTATFTILYLDARFGPPSSSPEILGPLLVDGVEDATQLLVRLDNGVNGSELWITDGTQTDSVLFKDINPGAGDSLAGPWTSVNGHAVFVADDGSHGSELWVSDGTAIGTTLLLDARPGAEGSAPSLVGYLSVGGVVDTGRALFLLDDGLTGQELWVTDGTPGGTVLFRDANAGLAGSFATGGLELTIPTVDLSPSPVSVVFALGATDSANNVIGSGFGDTLDGNGGNNVLLGGGGDDQLRGLGGNDLIDGGAGLNSAMFTGIRGASELRFEEPTPGVFNVVVVGPDGVDTTTNVQSIQFSDRTTQIYGTSGVQHLVSVSFPNTSINRFMLGDAYTGGVVGLTDEFIFPTPENINIASTLPSAFIRTGSGNDAITVFSGRNVIDAFTGSNFLTGGSGQDTFFLDARGGGVTWDSIVGFGVGDEVTLFGYIDGVSIDGFDKDKWYESDGVDPFKGLTVHAKLDGTSISASITFAGLTFADRNNLAVTTGTVEGSEYLYITRVA